MRLRPNVALQQTGRLLMKRASRALLLIALQLNLGVDMTGLLSRCEEGRVAWGSIDGESC